MAVLQVVMAVGGPECFKDIYHPDLLRVNVLFVCMLGMCLLDVMSRPLHAKVGCAVISTSATHLPAGCFRLDLPGRATATCKTINPILSLQ